MRRSMLQAVGVPLTTARIALRLHRANLAVRLAESRDLRSSARALRAEAVLVRHRARTAGD